jgi:GTP-binding protein EngB required for normal cell division
VTTLDDQIAALRDGIGHGKALGLEKTVELAEQVLENAEHRQGFLGRTYVLALVGGTGVGKSSLLNTLAGRSVSTVSAVRPTTDQPLAWVAGSRRDELAPLLEWLGISEVQIHEDDALESVAILDMPDFDSVALDHRQTVDRLLPKVDGVIWVVDPEKYDDERLHTYLRRLGPRAERVRFVLNKTDRLHPSDEVRVVDDLVERLTADGVDNAAIFPVAATTGAGTAHLLETLESDADAKQIVVDRLVAASRAAIDDLAADAGVADGFRPLLDESAREDYIERAVSAAIELVDPAGVSRQLRASLTSRAGIRAGSVFSRLVWLVRLFTGHRRRHADPVRHLLTWRSRGALGRVINPIREALLTAVAELPAAARPSLGAGGETMEDVVEEALDRAVDRSAEAVPDRGSWVWAFLGLLQILATAGVVFAIAWYLTLILGPGDLAVGTVDIPYLGPVPLPLVVGAGSLLASLLIAALARLHAIWLGSRESRRLRKRIAEVVRSSVENAGFRRLDSVESARRSLAEIAAATGDTLKR